MKGFVTKATREGLLRMEAVLPRAIDGDYRALCNVLFFLSEAIKQGVPLTPKSANFLADALRRIADGGDAKEAFHIRRKRGERDTREAEDKAAFLVLSVALLRAHKPHEKPMTIERAVAKVAEESATPEDTVRAAWRDYRKCVELGDDQECAFFLGTSARRPTRSKGKIAKK